MHDSKGIFNVEVLHAETVDSLSFCQRVRKEGSFKRHCLNEKQKGSDEQEIEVVKGMTEDPEVRVWNNDEHLLKEFRKNRLEFWRIT